MDEEHIVAEYIADGVPVLVSDLAYRGKNERELEEVRENARKIAWNIQINSNDNK